MVEEGIAFQSRSTKERGKWRRWGNHCIVLRYGGEVPGF